MKKTSLSFVILPVCLILAGCGTDEYQSRLNKSVSGTSSGSKFSVLGPETTIPGTTVSIRIPNAKPTPLQPMDINDAVRGKWPFSFEIQGLKATYEGSVEEPDTKNKQTFYLYVSVTDQMANNLTPARGWLEEMKQKFPNSADSSAEVNKNYSAATPEGSTTPCEEFHYNKCLQKFFYPKPSNPNNSQEMPGNVICLCHTENGKVVSLIFRYPSNLSEYHSTNFDPDWINLIAGTLKIGASGG